MSELLSAIEEFRAEDLRNLTDEGLEEEFAELHRASEMLEAERLRRLAAIDRRGTYRRDAYLSTTSWMAHRFRMRHAVACDQVRTARGLDRMPKISEALASGEISSCGARVLVRAREAEPAVFAEHEETLVEAAMNLRISELKHAVAYWRQGVDPVGAADDADRLVEDRRLYLSPTLGGMVRVDGDLDPENGELLLTALRAVLDAEARSGGASDGRSPAQRRADAIGEIVRQWLAHLDRPEIAGERPHMTVIVGRGVLQDGAGGPCELEHTGPVAPQVAERLACDASIRRVIMGPNSELLDVGRATPHPPASLRRAVVLRDRHCRFPGCDRPFSWCQPHHVWHWTRGGPTSLANLLLLCTAHHRLVHKRDGFRVEMTEGVAAFFRPDGSEVTDQTLGRWAPDP